MNMPRAGAEPTPSDQESGIIPPNYFGLRMGKIKLVKEIRDYTFMIFVNDHVAKP